MINANDKRMIGGVGVNNLSPMKYTWAKQYWELGMSTHWGLEKLNMSKDYNDFRSLSPMEQHIFINVLAYLTTSDILAQRNVINVVHGHITAPEVTLYLARQGFDETVHTMTYQHLIESMGLEEHDLYGRYLTVPAINNKIRYANRIMDLGTSVNPLDNKESLLTFIKSYLFFAMIFEGIWFYHGFTPILALTRQGKLPGSTSAFEYILRDEANHCAFGMRVVKTIMEENQIALTDIQDDIHQMLFDAHECEAEYINFILPDGSVPGYSVTDHLNHFQYMANRRCREFGFASLYDETMSNPLPWLDQAVSLKKEKNFFETTVTEYDNTGLNWD